ncbi:MAG: glycosyltransferase [Firmicutes bacterium]|nr:glycosyltransferase [Bacillota bacterium]
MRVLLAAMALELGGAETHVVGLAQALKRRGVEVEVASSGGTLAGELERAGIAHYVLPLDRRSPLALAASVAGLRTLLARGGYDVVHTHARIPAWAAEQARRGLGGPGLPVALVTTYHGLYADGWFWRRFTVWGEAVIAVSEDVREHLLDRLGAPPDRLRVIPNGIDLERFPWSEPPGTAGSAEGGEGPGAAAQAEAPATAAGGAPRPCVLHVSRLSEFAETALALAEAAPALAARHPGLRLRIAGSGSRLAEVRRAAERANRRSGAPVVEVLGARRDIPELLAGAWVVVAVARAALEAMAVGRPVVLSGQGGYGGLLEPSSLPRFEPRNFTARGCGRPVEPALLEREIDRLLGDARLRRELGRFGRQVVEERYSLESVARRTEEVYREALRTLALRRARQRGAGAKEAGPWKPTM